MALSFALPKMNVLIIPILNLVAACLKGEAEKLQALYC